MTFLYGSKLPESPTFAPTAEDLRARQDAAGALWDASRDLAVFRDNTTAVAASIAEGYQRRIDAIHDATGVMIDNPALKPENTLGPRGQIILRTNADVEAEFRQALYDVAEAHPEAVDVIGLDRPIIEDAYAVTRAAEQRFGEAAAAASGLPLTKRILSTLGGGLAGMMRDPLQVATLFVGGGTGAFRTVAGRVLETVLTEAAVNGGVELALQASSQPYRRAAGVEHGLGPALQQAGLAAMFGGGFGGLMAGGVEVSRLLGRAIPGDALERAAQGQPRPGDIEAIGAALGVEIDPLTARSAALAGEQQALDAAAFGPPPSGVSPVEAERLAADAVRLVEDEPDRLPSSDLEARASQVDAIVKSQFPVGKPPRRPTPLLEFLANEGGIRDHNGELAAMNAHAYKTHRFRPLVSAKGRTLDMAREAAEEAGYIGRLDDYQTTTVDDLLEAIRRELGGDRIYSPADHDLLTRRATYEEGVRAREQYRGLVERVDTAIGALGIDHRLDDGLLIRAVELIDDETDAEAALERALEEDYRAAADDAAAAGEGVSDDHDIPFFEADQEPDAGRVPGGSREAGPDGGDAVARGGGQAARGGEQFPRAGGDEAAEDRLAAAPEPGTAEAEAQADAILLEARRPDGGSSEKTPAGEQTLLAGVAPVSTRERLEAEGAKPLKGGDAAPPEGGLFDLESRQQLDIWDAMPAATGADGRKLFATYDDMIADADRRQHLSDLIASCKD